MNFKGIMLLLACIFMLASPAEAHKKVRPVVQEDPFAAFFNSKPLYVPATTTATISPSRRGTQNASVQYLPHPEGCPRRAFCGCGAALAVFGKNVRELWLARNWFKFQRTSPASGMVAVRRSHVFVLRSHVSGNDWMVEDYNSGRGKSRIHIRSIAGHTIVNPRA